jgi:hypothetical protein
VAELFFPLRQHTLDVVHNIPFVTVCRHRAVEVTQ